MKFKEFRKYISKIDRVSICNNDTLAYKNYQFIADVPDDYDEMYLYGVGMIKSEFPASQAAEMPKSPLDESLVYVDCLEIVLSAEERVE